ncbi:MAG: hypothetical protein JW969_15285 [Spirochaetales bacterium]|nr:hypothetical protein [Spirochaetales bacterium]
MSEEQKKKFHKKWEELNIGLKVLIITGGVILVAGLMVLMGFIVMWLWNWLMPHLFGLPVISYWEAWGIFILSQILFRGFHGSHHASERGRKRKLRNRIREMDDETLATDFTAE